MKEHYHLEQLSTIPYEYEEILYHGIDNDAFRAKKIDPIRSFSIFIKDHKEKVHGGITGVTLFGSLHIDTLWVDEILRYQKWGTKLMQEAEQHGRKSGVHFITVNTMDWQALPFYQKLGYTIEFTRDGYEKDSKMYMLRKPL